MKKKILIMGIISGVLLLLIIAVAAAGRRHTSGSRANPASALVAGAEASDGKRADGALDREPEFAPFSVIDDGHALPDNQEYTGLVCSIKDSLPETISVTFPDGEVREEEVSTMNLNNIWFSVPKGGSRCFGVPVFSTEY